MDSRHRTAAFPRAARAAEWYAGRLGWALVPIPPGSKGPKTPGWQEHPVRGAAEAMRCWARRPDWGMGLLHGASGTAALDADAPADQVARALAMVGVDYRGLLAAGTPAIVGNPAKPPKLLFRLPTGFAPTRRALRWPDPEVPTRRVVIFELRAGPVQDVLPPSVHPGTGRPYRWIPRPPERPEDVPELPAELAALWTEWPARVRAMEAACPWWTPAPEPERPTAAPVRASDEPSLIALYNLMVPPARILERNGYRPARGERGRWVCPGSTTGTPGVVLLDDGRVYSHHASDPLGDGHAHDAFDVLRVLECGGDFRAAIRAARIELGLRVYDGDAGGR